MVMGPQLRPCVRLMRTMSVPPAGRDAADAAVANIAPAFGKRQMPAVRPVEHNRRQAQALADGTVSAGHVRLEDLDGHLRPGDGIVCAWSSLLCGR